MEWKTWVNGEVLFASDVNAIQTGKADIRKLTAAGRVALGGLSVGEFGLDTDTRNLYIGSSVGDIRVHGDYITPEMYGAVGDGVADDTAAIQAAIDAAQNDGGVVLLGSGKKYRITSKVTISKPVTLAGSGYGGYANGSQSAWLMPSVIYNDSQTDDAISIALPSSDHLGGVILSNFHIRGNRGVSGASSGSGIRFSGGSVSTSIRNWVIKDVWVRDCQEHGISLVGNVFEGEIINCHAMNNVLDGLYTEAVSARPPAHVKIRNLNSELNDRYGANFQGGGVGMVSLGSYYAANAQHGVYAEGNFSSIGDMYEGNGTGASGTYSNIYVNSGHSQITNALLVGQGVSKYNIDLHGGYYHSVGPCYFDSSADYDIHISAGLCGVYRPIYMTDTGKFIETPANSGAVRSSNVVTITTTSAHGFSIGDRVEILEVSDDSMNYEFVITDVPTTTTFTFASSGSDITSGNGRCNRAFVYDESGTAFRYDKLAVNKDGAISISGATSPDLGAIRLGFTRRIAWRNAGDTADVLLYMNASNMLVWEGFGGVISSGPLYAAAGAVVGWTDANMYRLGASLLTFGSTEINGITLTDAHVQKTGTVPSSSADAFKLYSADIAAGNAAPHFRTENGKIVKLYQQVLTAGLEEAYEAGELDSEAEIITATNATNAKLNDLIEALQNTGLLASS